VEDKGCANRASFIIGKDGKVAFALYNGFDARSNAEYTKVLATL
jgi:peroxiredoxin